MTKKIIAFVLAASLCIGSASAVDVYEVDQDARPLMMMASNSGISTAAVSDSWYDFVLQNLEWIMADMDSVSSSSSNISSKSTLIYNLLNSSLVPDVSSILDYVADSVGWLGVYDGGLQLNELLGQLYDVTFSVDSSVDALDSHFLTWKDGFNSSFASMLTDVESLASDVDSVLDLLNDVYDEYGYYSDLLTEVENIADWMGVNDNDWQLNEYLSFIDDNTYELLTAFGAYNTSFGSYSTAFSSFVDSTKIPAGTAYLNSLGQSFVNNSAPTTLAAYVRLGFLGLASLLRAESGESVLASSGVSTTLNSSVGLDWIVRNGFIGLASALDTDFSGLISSLDADFLAQNNLLTSQLNTGVGMTFVNSIGHSSTSEGNVPFSSLVRIGLAGLASLLRAESGEMVLTSSGSSFALTSVAGVDWVLRNGFLGLSSNLKEISSGSYSLSLFDSETASQGSVSASTMGQMIHQYADALQDDLGALTFMYADQESIQAKKDSASTSGAVLDGFIKPGSAGSVGVSDIGAAASAVSGTKEMFNTGVSIGQAFDQLQGSGPLEFFTAQTAANLNTVPVTYSDDDDFVHFYDASNSEFFELIGKGGN